MDISTRIVLTWALVAALAIGSSRGRFISTAAPDDTFFNGTEIAQNITQKVGGNATTAAGLLTPTQPGPIITLPPGVPIKELEALIREEISKVEEERSKCLYGEFYSFTHDTCELCTTKCKSHVDMEFCGRECYAYFQNEDRKHESRTSIWVTGGLFIGCAILMMLVVSSLYKNRQLQQKIKSIEERNRGFPDGDKLGDREDPHAPLMED